jgi:membrane protein required for beta-lactamase induction
LLLVAYAFLMSLAPLIVRYPNETVQIVCASLQHIVDWRTWVLLASVGCLVGILIIALKRRH